MKAPQPIHTNEFIGHIAENERLIYKVCSMYSQHAEDRKDLFQEIVLQAWRAYPKFRGQSAFGTWLYKLALNTAITYRRRSKKDIISSFGELPDIYPHCNLNAIEEEQYRVMHKMISELPGMEKALMLLYMDDYSHQQIADMLGISTSNVGTKLGRIKDKLKKQASSLDN